MNPLLKTATMGIIAVATTLAAAAFYPWPEPVVQSEMVGKPLFEPFESSRVRSISIVSYNRERAALERFQILRKGEKWIIPSHKNYMADNSAQISAAVSALSGKVLENSSSDQKDHVDFGVVDPLEFESTTNRSSLGTRIVLEDRNQRELGSLIVGSRVGSKSQTDERRRFVRVPGQPHVYEMEINPAALETDFTRWVNTNLLQLSKEFPVDKLAINNYRLDSSQPDASKKEWKYSAIFDLQNQSTELLAPAGDDQQLESIGLTESYEQQILGLANFIGNLRFTEVVKNSSAITAALKKRELDDLAVFDELKALGFVAKFDDGLEASKARNKSLRFEAVAGELVVHFADGVSVSVLFGNLAETTSTGDLSLKHHVMLRASVDESRFPIPAPPAKDLDSLSEQQRKSYLREQENRQAKIKSATQRAADMNQLYADWIYIISEDIINGLRPDLQIEAPVLARPQPSSTEKPEKESDEQDEAGSDDASDEES